MWKVKIVDIFNSIHNARGVTCQAVLPWKPYKICLCLQNIKGPLMGTTYYEYSIHQFSFGYFNQCEGSFGFLRKIIFPSPGWSSPTTSSSVNHLQRPLTSSCHQNHVQCAKVGSELQKSVFLELHLDQISSCTFTNCWYQQQCGAKDQISWIKF